MRWRKWGPVTLGLEQRFRLHAVLEARDRGDRPVYYTRAERLRFAGGEEVSADRLRIWDRSPVRIRWFTVEGERPFVVLDAEAGIAAFTLRELVRSDWPLEWSVPGAIEPANDDHLEPDGALPPGLFGTQRYHVRVEIYRFEDDLIPRQVVRSWGVDDLRENHEAFPTVYRLTAGGSAPTSRVFGLSQLELPADPSPELLAQVYELAQAGVAFSRSTALRGQIEGRGASLGELAWRAVDLPGGLSWQPGEAMAGDLLRVGDRMVVLYEDRGDPGILDYGDLCFDFTQGAVVRSLQDVFSGEGLTVEWASLADNG